MPKRVSRNVVAHRAKREQVSTHVYVAVSTRACVCVCVYVCVCVCVCFEEVRIMPQCLSRSAATLLRIECSMSK